MHCRIGIAFFASCAMLAGACQSLPDVPRPVETPQVRLPPAPPEVMKEREPNFLKRLLDFLSDSPQRPMRSSSSSEPPSN